LSLVLSLEEVEVVCFRGDKRKVEAQRILRSGETEEEDFSKSPFISSLYYISRGAVVRPL